MTDQSVLRIRLPLPIRIVKPILSGICDSYNEGQGRTDKGYLVIEPFVDNLKVQVLDFYDLVWYSSDSGIVLSEMQKVKIHDNVKQCYLNLVNRLIPIFKN